jgi:hypothetical protein
MGASDDEWALWMRRRVREAVELLARDGRMCFPVQFCSPWHVWSWHSFSLLTKPYTYFWKKKVSETTLSKTAEEALAELQSLARYVCAETSS